MLQYRRLECAHRRGAWEGLRLPTTLEASWTYPDGEFVAFRGTGVPVRAER